jgi:PAS domain S-box-containing protein
MNEKSRKIYCLAALVGFLFMIFGSGEALAETEKTAESTITKIRTSEGWSYHVGDFERDEQGWPVGIHDDAAWTPQTSQQEVKSGPHTVVWFKRTLPERTHPNAVLYLSSYMWYQTVEVYLHDRQIYTFGQSSSTSKPRHLAWEWPLIPLPPEYSGKEILFRCDVGDLHAIRPIERLYIGEFNQLLTYFFVRDLDAAAVGITILIIGIVGYIVFLAVYWMHNAALCAFASLAVFSAIHLFVAQTVVFPAFVTHVLSLSWFRHTYYMSYFLFAAGVWAFIAHTPWIGWKSGSRLLWQLHVLCAIAVLVFERVNHRFSAVAYDSSLMVVFVGSGVYMIKAINAIIRNNREARILGVGLMILGIGGCLDIWGTLQIPIVSRSPLPWGMLGFLMSLAYLLVLRYQSERRQAEDVIRNSEERLAGIIVALTDAIIMIDERDRIVWANDIAKSLFRSELIDQTYTAALSHLQKLSEPYPVKACFQDGRTYECETELASDKGNRRHFWCVTSVAARHADGSPKTVIHVLHDITDMKRLQTEAAHSARLASLGELAAGVAHEINNPISGIISCAEFLADEYQGQGTPAEMLDMIIQEGQRVAKITGNLLSFSRKQQHVLKPVQMQEIIADALALEAKLFQKSRIIIKLDIPEQLPMVMANRQQLQQVFINLLNNARYALNQSNKAQQEEKIVEVQCTIILLQDRHYVRTTVSDNGPGIPEDILDKICDPFYTSKPRGEGTGLGLSISYGIIEAHQGRLFFESQEGSYTRAIIDLPVITT